MTFNNSTNASNSDFQQTSGTEEFALRTRKVQVAGCENIGFTYSAGVFTITDAAGATLSPTNRAFVTVPSQSSIGTMKTITITANQSFQDQSGTSTINGNLFGTTTSVAWAQDIPFYLYAVLDSVASETNIAFAFSRVPHLTVSPVAGKLAKSGSAVASTQGSMYLMPNITVANYASSGLLLLGSFRMRKDSTDRWTVQAISNGDGIAVYNENTIFNMPIGQNGNAATTWFAANGGTAPVPTSPTVIYQMNRLGEVNFIFDGGALTSNGVGAVTLTMNFPLAYKSQSRRASQFYFTGSTGVINIGMVTNPTADTTASVKFSVWNTTTSGATLQNQDYTGTAHVDSFIFDYIASIL